MCESFKVAISCVSLLRWPVHVDVIMFHTFVAYFVILISHAF